MNKLLRWWMLASLIAFAGCAGVTPHPGGPAPVVEPGAPAAPSGSGASGGSGSAQSGAGSSAVLALVDRADRSARAGQLGAAADSLERALRIEPGNARLWHRLAAVRLAEGNLAQAQALAAKSNSLAGNDLALQIANWRLIAAARQQAGDAAGASRAQARLKALQGR